MRLIGIYRFGLQPHIPREPFSLAAWTPGEEDLGALLVEEGRAQTRQAHVRGDGVGVRGIVVVVQQIVVALVRDHHTDGLLIAFLENKDPGDCCKRQEGDIKRLNLTTHRDFGDESLVVFEVLVKLVHPAEGQLARRLILVHGQLQLGVVVVILEIVLQRLLVLAQGEQGQVVKVVVSEKKRDGWR